MEHSRRRQIFQVRTMAVSRSDRKNIERDFPIDTREKITIKIDPDFILDVRGYMQHSGFKGSADHMRKYCA